MKVCVCVFMCKEGAMIRMKKGAPVSDRLMSCSRHTSTFPAKLRRAFSGRTLPEYMYTNLDGNFAA